MLNNRIACHGSSVKKKSVEMAKTEVKPCVTKKLSPDEIAAELEKMGVKDMRKTETKKKPGRPRKNQPVDVAPDIIPSEPSEMSEPVKPAVTENKKCIITLDDIDKAIEKVHYDLDDLMATKRTIERMAAGNEIAVEVDADA